MNARHTLACTAILTLTAVFAAAQENGPFDGLRFREIGPATPAGRIDDFAVLQSNPAVFLRGDRHRWYLEDDEQRYDVRDGVRRPNHFLHRRSRDRSRRPEPRLGGNGREQQPAELFPGVTESTSRPTAARRGRTWGSGNRCTSRALSSIRPTWTSSTSPLSGASGAREASAVSTRRPTVARASSASCTSTTTLARPSS